MPDPQCQSTSYSACPPFACYGCFGKTFRERTSERVGEQKMDNKEFGQHTKHRPFSCDSNEGMVRSPDRCARGTALSPTDTCLRPLKPCTVWMYGDAAPATMEDQHSSLQ